MTQDWEAHRPQLSPSPHASPAQVPPLRPLDSSSPGLPLLGLSLTSLPLPAQPSYHIGHTRALDFCKLRCLVQDLTAISLPTEPHPPLFTLGGGKPRSEVSSGPHKSPTPGQPHWFGPGDLGLQRPKPTTLLGPLFQLPPPSPVGNAGLAFTRHFKNKTCSQHKATYSFPSSTVLTQRLWVQLPSTPAPL